MRIIKDEIKMKLGFLSIQELLLFHLNSYVKHTDINIGYISYYNMQKK